jgi:hypothetical protein
LTPVQAEIMNALPHLSEELQQGFLAMARAALKVGE